MFESYALLNVDRIGRRPLLLIGSSALSLALVTMGLGLQAKLAAGSTGVTSSSLVVFSGLGEIPGLIRAFCVWTRYLCCAAPNAFDVFALDRVPRLSFQACTWLPTQFLSDQLLGWSCPKSSRRVSAGKRWASLLRCVGQPGMRQIGCALASSRSVMSLRRDFKPVVGGPFPTCNC